ncbi:hypothetical protein WA026_018852 [Henosepilachna vigintioctopunctata]|uniref:Uncharacterized protein n=1 Tax=Henosepilachna vigintioctopunctata TaxID=420089 RepID=A0AAW1UQ80_9CUCU
MGANSVAEKWSINPEFSKTRQRRVKRYFDELSEDDRLQDPESLFKVNIFYRVLDIIIRDEVEKSSCFRDLGDIGYLELLLLHRKASEYLYDECEFSNPHWASVGAIAHSLSPGQRRGQWRAVGHISTTCY